MIVLADHGAVGAGAADPDAAEVGSGAAAGEAGSGAAAGESQSSAKERCDVLLHGGMGICAACAADAAKMGARAADAAATDAGRCAADADATERLGGADKRSPASGWKGGGIPVGFFRCLRRTSEYDRSFTAGTAGRGGTASAGDLCGTCGGGGRVDDDGGGGGGGGGDGCCGDTAVSGNSGGGDSSGGGGTSGGDGTGGGGGLSGGGGGGGGDGAARAIVAVRSSAFIGHASWCCKT